MWNFFQSKFNLGKILGLVLLPEESFLLYPLLFLFKFSLEVYGAMEFNTQRLSCAFSISDDIIYDHPPWELSCYLLSGYAILSAHSIEFIFLEEVLTQLFHYIHSDVMHFIVFDIYIGDGILGKRLWHGAKVVIFVTNVVFGSEGCNYFLTTLLWHLVLGKKWFVIFFIISLVRKDWSVTTCCRGWFSLPIEKTRDVRIFRWLEKRLVSSGRIFLIVLLASNNFKERIDNFRPVLSSLFLIFNLWVYSFTKLWRSILHYLLRKIILLLI